MREILFRGKSTDNGQWIEGYYVIAKHWLTDKPVCIICNDPSLYPSQEFSGVREVIPETVGQYTGLTDRNGRRIFEGDIVRFYYDSLKKLSAEVGEVKYGEFNCTCCDGVYGWYFDNGEDIRHHTDYEVVGNRWDNPELLKEATDE